MFKKGSLSKPYSATFNTKIGLIRNTLEGICPKIPAPLVGDHNDSCRYINNLPLVSPQNPEKKLLLCYLVRKRYSVLLRNQPVVPSSARLRRTLRARVRDHHTRGQWWRSAPIDPRWAPVRWRPRAERRRSQPPSPPDRPPSSLVSLLVSRRPDPACPSVHTPSHFPAYSFNNALSTWTWTCTVCSYSARSGTLLIISLSCSVHV